MIKRLLFSLLCIFGPLLVFILGVIGLILSGIYALIELVIFVIFAYPCWVVTGTNIFKFMSTPYVFGFLLIPFCKLDSFVEFKFKSLRGTRGAKTLTYSPESEGFKKILTQKTGLPVDIYIDNAGIWWRRLNLANPVLYVRNCSPSLLAEINKDEYIPVIISKNPTVRSEETRLDCGDLDKVLDFVRINYSKLTDISLQYLEIEQLYKNGLGET